MSQESFPSDRLIGVWVVTKKDSILLSCLSCKVKSFFLKKKKLYQNVIVPGFKNVPSGFEGRFADPTGKELSCQGLTQALE